ncbi:MAG: hypothetical protein AB1414_10410 [bacterium]
MVTGNYLTSYHLTSYHLTSYHLTSYHLTNYQAKEEDIWKVTVRLSVLAGRYY